MSPFMTWSLLVKAHGPHRPMGAERAGCPWELQMTDRGPEMSSDLPKVTQLGNARAWIPTPVSCTRVPAPHCPAEGRGQIAATRSCPGRDTHHTPDKHRFWAVLCHQDFQVGSHAVFCAVVQINAPMLHLLTGRWGGDGEKAFETNMRQKTTKHPKPQTKKAV